MCARGVFVWESAHIHKRKGKLRNDVCALCDHTEKEV